MVEEHGEDSHKRYGRIDLICWRKGTSRVLPRVCYTAFETSGLLRRQSNDICKTNFRVSRCLYTHVLVAIYALVAEPSKLLN
jgi:hypothetical protein